MLWKMNLELRQLHVREKFQHSFNTSQKRFNELTEKQEIFSCLNSGNQQNIQKCKIPVLEHTLRKFNYNECFKFNGTAILMLKPYIIIMNMIQCFFSLS